jgi:hypothetical protein
MKHLEHTLEAYVYSHYNICNIDIQHLQHTSETSKTLETLLQHAVFILLLPYDATQNGGMSDS